MLGALFKQRVRDLGFQFIPPSDVSLSATAKHSHQKIALTKNKEGTYDVSLPSLKPNQHYQFLDDYACVLDIYTTPDVIEIDVHSARQVHLSGPLSFACIKIHAKGPLVFQSNIECQQFHLQAPSAWFNGQINAQVAEMHCTKGLAFLEKVNADVVKCDADDIYLSAALAVRHCLDLKSVTYEQAASATVIVQGAARVSAEDLYLNGHFDVCQKALIIADKVLIGAEKGRGDQAQHVQLPAETYFRASRCILKDNSQFDIISNPKKSAVMLVYYIEISKGSSAKLTHVEMKNHVIRNQGQLDVSDALIESDCISQFGEAKFVHAHLNVHEIFDACQSTSLLHSEVSAKQFRSTALTSVEDCTLSVFYFTVASGKFSANSKTEMCVGSALIQQDAHFNMQHGKVEAEQRFLSLGRCDLQEISLFEADSVIFHGEIAAEGCYFISRSLDFYTEKLLLRTCRGRVDTLRFNTVSESAVLDQTQFSTQFLLQQGVLNIENHSTIYGDNGEKSYFLVEGDLTCKDSKLFSDGYIYFRNKAKIRQLAGMLHAKHVHSQTEMSAEEATFFSETFHQQRASLAVDQTRIYASHRFSSEKSRITAKSSQLFAQIIKHQGEIFLTNSKLQSADQVMQAEQFHSADASFTQQRAAFHQQTTAKNMQLMAHEVQLHDHFDVEQSVIVAEKYVSFRPSSKGRLKKTMIKARDVDVHSAALTTISSQLQADHYLVTRPTSVLIVENTALQSSHRSYLQGKMKKNTESALVMLSAQDELDIASTAEIQVGQLVVEAKVTKNRGSIRPDQFFQLKGDMFYNQNTIYAETVALYLNHGFANLCGDLSAKNITIHGNVFNYFSRIYADQNYTQYGLVNLNAGLVCASNIYSANLLSLNAGLVLPNFSADPAYWFSSANLYGVARTGLSFLLPAPFSHEANLIFGVPGLVGGAVGLYQLAKKYNSWKKFKNMPLYEVIPIVCQLKNAVTMTIGAVTHAKHFHAGIKNFRQNLVYDVNWAQLGRQSLSLLGGHYVDDSLVSLNAGATFAQSTARASLLHFNAGAEASLQSHSVSSYCMGNTGFSGGGQSSFSAKHGMNAGQLYGHHGLHLDYGHLYNTQAGAISGKHITGHIKHFSQGGKINWQQGNITIDHFDGRASVDNNLQDMGITGNSANFSGLMRVKGVYFDYHTSVSLDEALHGDLADTHFKTDRFSHQGHMRYDHTVSVNADRVIFHEGSVVKGMVSPKTDPAAPVAEDSGNAIAEPGHQLLVNSRQVYLDGKLSGGDYTQIQGQRNAEGVSQKCERLDIGEHADVQLDGARLSSEASEVRGCLGLKNAHVNLDRVEALDHAVIGLTQSVMTGKMLHSVSAQLNVNHAKVDYEQGGFEKEAKEHLEGAHLQFGLLDDSSNMSYAGHVFVESDQYHHDGHIAFTGDDAESSFRVKTKQASLQGSANIAQGVYDIEHFQDGLDFVSGNGTYGNYHFLKQLNYQTEDSLYVNQPYQRGSDLFVQAKEVQWDSAISGNQWIGLQSTAGDVSLTQDMTLGGLWVKSAGKLYTNHAIKTEEDIQLQAADSYYNLGGTLNGKRVVVSAAEIFNVTHGSEFALQHTWQHAIGDSGVFNGRQQTFLRSTVGNIENHGGIIRGGEYAQLVSARDVKNVCNVRSYQGSHDVIKEFDAALISGGRGSEATQGVGLYIKADGRTYLDASDFIADGDIYVESEKDIEFAARSHTYISRKEKKKKGKKKKEIVETSTNARGCRIQSTFGRNIIYSTDGGVKGIAANFISPGGTDIYADDKVELFSLKTQDSYHEKKSNWWGLSNKKRDEIHESSAPTLFLDNGATRIHSETETVDLRGALFLGDGDLEIVAGKNKKIIFGCDVLNHCVREKTRRFGVQLPGYHGWSAYQSGGNFWDIATAEDATLAKMQSFFDSQDTLSYLTNAWNLGIDLFNTANNLIRGLANDNLMGELLARYDLGGAGTFMPKAVLSFTATDTRSTYQTLGSGGVNRGGHARYCADGGIELHNGVQVRNGGDAEIDASSIEAHGAKLHAVYHHQEKSVHVGVTPVGDIADVGIAFNKTKSTSVSHVNATLACGCKMSLSNKGGAVDQINLHNANIRAGSIDMPHAVNEINITTESDTAHSSTQSASASSSGQVSAYVWERHETYAAQSAGIYAREGLNTHGNRFEVGHVRMTGNAKITTDGENHAVLHNVSAMPTQESTRARGMGVGFNVHDVSRVTGHGQPTHQAGEQAIATASLSFSGQRYDAVVSPVISGEQGNHVQIGHLAGDLHTSSVDGRCVVRNHTVGAVIDVPMTNKAHLAQAAQNISVGSQKMASFFHTKNTDMPVDALTYKSNPVAMQSVEAQTEEPEMVSPQDLPELTPALLQQAVEHMDEAQQADFNLMLRQANSELETDGIISKSTENALMDKLSETLFKTMKASVEYGWGEIISGLGEAYSDNAIKMLLTKGMRDKGGVKLFMTSKGLMFTFSMNLALTGSCPSKEEVKQAAMNTADDFVVGFVLGSALGAAAPYVMGTITVLDIVDTLTYDEARVQEQFRQAHEFRSDAMEAYSKGRWFAGMGLFETSRDFREAAALSQGLHEGLRILNSIKPIERIRQYFREGSPAANPATLFHHPQAQADALPPPLPPQAEAHPTSVSAVSP
jgi:hypothetical protein